MTGAWFDEKAIIALAFFTCIGLIVKFFGKSFIEFLKSKRNEIMNVISKTENQFDSMIKTIEDLKKQEQFVNERNKTLDETTEKEIQFILGNAEKNSQDSLKISLQNQKLIIKRLSVEVEDSFSKMPFDVSKQVITNLFLQPNNLNLQHEVINTALDSILGNNSLNSNTSAKHSSTQHSKNEHQITNPNVKKKLNVLLVGGGGREHALGWKLSSSHSIKKLFSIDGSDRISLFAEKVDIDWRHFEKVYDFCRIREIDLVVIGPEKPIVEGLSDFLRKRDILVFAPSQTGSKIESSKEFTKIICQEKGIPTAKFKVFTELDRLKSWLNTSSEFPIVLKYDGLAGGKGVKICPDLNYAIASAEELYQNYKENFKIVAEKFLRGYEISFFAITDGKSTKRLAFAQDHKRAFDNDEGENTGGMGVISGNFLVNQELEDRIMEQIIHPTVNYLNENDILYRGVLFAGLMIDENNQPHLLEFNARLGDPETEAIMMRFDSDLLELLYDTAAGKLEGSEVKISEKSSLCVVLATNGYPEEYEKNLFIAKTLPEDSEDCKIFHHSTKFENNGWYSNGGRVLSINILGSNIREMRSKAHEILKNIHWKSGFYRRDIGKKHE